MPTDADRLRSAARPVLTSSVRDASFVYAGRVAGTVKQRPVFLCSRVQTLPDFRCLLGCLWPWLGPRLAASGNVTYTYFRFVDDVAGPGAESDVYDCLAYTPRAAARADVI